MSEPPQFQSAELHRLLIASVSEYAIFALDATGHVRTWNPGAERLKGYTADEIIGRHFSTFYPDVDLRTGKPARGLERAARDGHFEDEGWRVRKDGSRFWANVVITALRDERGELVGFAKITRDLTDWREREEQTRALAAESAARAAADRRREEVERLNEQLQQQAAELELQTEAAQALSAELEEQATELEAANAELVDTLGVAEEARERARESETRYRLLFDANPMPMCVYDRTTHRLLAVNQATVEQYGYSRDELLAMTVDDLRATDDVASLREPGVRAPREIRRLMGRRHRRKDSSLIDVEIVSHPIEYDGHDAELVLVHDVTRRRHTEARLNETSDVLRAVVDDSPLAIIVLGLGLEVLRWNPAAEQLLGWTASEMLGRSYDKVIPREKWEEHRALREDALRGIMTMNVETHRFRKDGSLIDVSLSVAVLRDPLGAIRGYAVFMAGMTERRRLEAQLRQAQKMEAVGQLAGGIAHDFNNLLTVITAHTQLALEALPPDQAVRADLKAVNEAATHAANLTRQLLAFSRKQLLKPQVLDLNATVSNVTPMLERLIGEDIEIATRLDASLGYTTADPAQLEQVLVNLAVNARDAMPQGGVLLIETANVELDETYSVQHEAEVATGPYVLLTVGDTGSGMDAATRALIFEPFFTTKEPGRGTGLGLATVYGIVKQSDGYIWVYSEPGYGTRFRIYLPRTSSGVEAAVSTPPPASPRGGSETVLVVEDEAPLRRIVQRILDRQGYTVYVSASGADALHVARELDGRIDLVVTDVILPEMSGPVLAEQLTAAWPRTKVLFMSGYTDDDVVRRGLLKPGMTLLGKPFTLDDLARTVRRVLDSDSPRTSPDAAPR